MKGTFLSILASFFMCSGLHCSEQSKTEYLKEWLHERIWEYETHKKLLTDSSDIYTYYLVFGKQSAYEEMLILLDKLERDEVPPLKQSENR